MSRSFLIAAASRKGTHLLETALAERPDVLIHGQVFAYPSYRPTRSTATLLRQLFDKQIPVAIVSAAWRAGVDRYPDLWEALRSRRVGVIHLHRRNMLRWYVSCKIAESTNQWIAFSPPDAASPQIAVDLADFHAALEMDEDYARQIDRWFSDSPRLHLWYEDMAADFPTAIEQVQRFLGLQPLALAPGCYKQQRAALPEIISNYADLAAAWSGTAYEAWLRDDPCEGVLPQEERD